MRNGEPRPVAQVLGPSKSFQERQEAYFYAKLHPKEAEEAKASQENPKVDPKAEERKDFERKLEAVPRKQKQKKPKKGKSEL